MHWEDHAKRNTDIHEHLSTLFEYASKCKQVVEWGVRTGESTIALLEGVKQNKGGLTSVDIDSCYLAKFTIWRYGLSNWWKFIQGDDLKVEVPWAEMVFIDTSHYLAHTIKEIDKAISMEPKYVFLHDVNAPLWPDMPKAIELAKAKYPDYIYSQWDNCYGLGKFERKE